MKRVFAWLLMGVILVLGSAFWWRSTSTKQAQVVDPPAAAYQKRARGSKVGTNGDPERGQPSSAPLVEASDALIPRYHPRAAGEWDGMLVDTSRPQICETSENCGLALACADGRCGPCRRVRDCAVGETCVLDHCLLVDLVECRQKAECPGERQVCALSGYSPDPRGNEVLRAYCLDELSGREMPDATRGDPPDSEQDQVSKKSLESELLDLLKSQDAAKTEE